ncbi:MAG: leucine-rich repeat protein, partial [Synergistaceae bacterium]|nr:leucine-rich repeat protein [Synergistaceae bacterium]
MFSKTNKRLIWYPLTETATSYLIPQGITVIGDYAFSYCSSLASVTNPDSVTSISEGAFRYCSSLTSIN